jgi:hypothetical protein
VVESVVYLGLFAIIFLVVMQYFFSISAQNEYAESSIETEKSVIFLSDHISNTFGEIHSIDASSSQFNLDDGLLVLFTDDTLTTTVSYEIESDRIRFTDEASQQSYISDRNNEVTQFLIEQILNSEDELVGVRVTTVFDSKNINYQREFTTSYIIESAL